MKNLNYVALAANSNKIIFISGSTNITRNKTKIPHKLTINKNIKYKLNY